MAFGDLALGIASVLLGLHQIQKGTSRIAAAGRGQNNGLRYVQPRGLNGNLRGHPRISRELSGSRGFDVFSQAGGAPLMDSGRSMVKTPGGRLPMRMRTYEIRTLDDRINHLRKHVDLGKRDPQVYAFARRAVSRRCGNKWCVPEKDNLGEAKALFAALRANPHTARDLAAARQVFGNQRGNVRYTSDIMGVDTYQKPAHTIALKSGDCDDHSTLACSALGSVGIPCRFKVIRTKGAKEWNHIYAQAGLPRANPTHWVSLDSSVDMPFGWEAPKSMVAASRTFRVV